ncbi:MULTISPECIES: hypothetical protein [unclassified Streptomyces]|uniref:hypothetical protein n=1 Tax=unclassified Streptomyces TaxID=2593676 RepID=UPI000DC5CE6C|nr:MULTISPECIES: hypothetical protein [unclassified Streptomyces]MYT71190.1 hypothetical protein [Streptomyces sp. SID8367]RAJ69600.1 hypothetical protein K377_07994 [Streptomyces sp. PsTaAH-137]
MPEQVRVELVRNCAECGAAVEKSSPYEWRWVHVDEEAGRNGAQQTAEHRAQPVRRCADCKGPITNWQDPWADYAGCKACGTETRSSIGD